MASYKLTDTTRLNAQVSKGFRLGGINDPLNLPLCTPEDELIFGGRPTWNDEELWNYEIGSKSRIMNDRGAFNAALFYMDISDLQATVTAGQCSSRVIFNVPKARSAGVEVEFELAPSEVFDFAISASYIDSELRSTLISNGQVISGIQEGNRLPTVPEFQMAAAATYHWNVGDWAWYTTGVYQHIGSRFTQIGDQADGFGTVDLTALDFTIGAPLTQNTFTFEPELPSYDIINLRLGLLKNRWDAALFVNNVTDEEALLALDQERGTLARVGYVTNAPRTFGLSARVVF
jgi:iron complex outermembrane receptor protein